LIIISASLFITDHKSFTGILTDRRSVVKRQGE
jgi:hypothetical protein